MELCCLRCPVLGNSAQRLFFGIDVNVALKGKKSQCPGIGLSMADGDPYSVLTSPAPLLNIGEPYADATLSKFCATHSANANHNAALQRYTDNAVRR